MRCPIHGPFPDPDPALTEYCRSCHGTLVWMDDERQYGDTVHADNLILVCEECGKEAS